MPWPISFSGRVSNGRGRSYKPQPRPVQLLARPPIPAAQTGQQGATMSLPRATTQSNAPRWLACYAGQLCLGHILTRDRSKSFEAYDQSDQLIGSFNSQSAAADALANPWP